MNVNLQEGEEVLARRAGCWPSSARPKWERKKKNKNWPLAHLSERKISFAAHRGKEKEGDVLLGDLATA